MSTIYKWLYESSFFIFLYIILINLPFNFSYISFPFKREWKNDKLDKENIFSELSENIMPIKIKLGTPRQEVKLNIVSNMFYTYIADISVELNNITGFDSDSSSTYSSWMTYYKFNPDDFYSALVSDDNFTLGPNNEIENVNLKFLLAVILRYNTTLSNNPGRIGFDVTFGKYDKSTEFNFIKYIKDTKYIDNYNFFFNYKSNSLEKQSNDLNDEGEIIIGGMPYNIEGSKFKREDFTKTYLVTDSEGYLKWSFKCDNIFYGKQELNESYLFINFEDGMITAPQYMIEIINNNFFNEYLQNNKCKETNQTNYIYYDCDKEGVDYSKMKSLTFYNLVSNNSFVFKPEELFYEFENRKYFLIRFKASESEKNDNSWNIGRHLLIKYMIVFNQDKKQIQIYKTGESIPGEKEKKDGNDLVTIISLSAVIIILIGIIVYGIIYIVSIRQKRKRARELSEDYDYSPRLIVN